MPQNGASKQLPRASPYSQRSGTVGAIARVWKRSYAADYIGLILLLVCYALVFHLHLHSWSIPGAFPLRLPSIFKTDRAIQNRSKFSSPLSTTSSSSQMPASPIPIPSTSMSLPTPSLSYPSPSHSAPSSPFSPVRLRAPPHRRPISRSSHLPSPSPSPPF